MSVLAQPLPGLRGSSYGWHCECSKDVKKPAWFWMPYLSHNRPQSHMRPVFTGRNIHHRTQQQPAAGCRRGSSQRHPLVAKGHSIDSGTTLAKRDKSFPIRLHHVFFTHALSVGIFTQPTHKKEIETKTFNFSINSAVPPLYRMREDNDKQILSSAQHAIENNNGHIQEGKNKIA